MGHVAAPTAVRFEHRTDETLCWGSGPPPHDCPGSCRRPMPDSSRGLRGRAHPRRGDAAGRPGHQPRQVLVPWPAAPLTSRESVRVRVRVSGAGDWVGLERPGAVEAGLLGPSDWTARFISPRELGEAGCAGARARGRPSTCPAGSSGRGCTRPPTACTRPTLNGRASATRSWPPAGPATATGCATRPTTSPSWSVRAATTLEVLLGNGWYRGRLGFGTAGTPSTATGWRCSPSSR